MGNILNVKELVEACRQWRPPGFDRAECILEPITDSYRQACALRAFDALVGVHGAGLTNGLFLQPRRGAVVEVAVEGWAPPHEQEWCSFRKFYNHTTMLYFWYA